MKTDSLFDLHHRMIRVPRAELVASALARMIGRARRLLDIGSHDARVASRVGELVEAVEVRGVDVKVDPHAAIPVEAYDGRTLPFESDRFDAVVLSDVLHHCEDPARVLAEALRVAPVVGIKDHFCFGPLSRAMLLGMDLVGNFQPGIDVRGTYLTPAEWHRLWGSCGARLAAIDWPLDIHPPAIRWLTRSELQFAARIERAPNVEETP
jgi:SAM-dependent methyltransferase